jgi:phosphoribosyl 1,2-cyclic phosphodiesterase
VTDISVTFWGTRGSIPCPGPKTKKYGGNTSCIEVRAADKLCILDAGTGIRELGNRIVKEGKFKSLHLFVTHTHWDHIQGLPFFTPIYSPAYEMKIYGPRPLEGTLEAAVLHQMQYQYFPVRGVELQARLSFHDLDQEAADLGEVKVATKPMNHPIRVLAYKVGYAGKSVVYTGDNEPYYDIFLDAKLPDTQFIARSQFIKQCQDGVIEFVRGTDLLIADTQYTDEEYAQKRGWGHCSVSHVLELAQHAGVKRVAMFHHEPTHDDAALAKMEADAARRAGKGKKAPKVFMAREGQTIKI